MQCDGYSAFRLLERGLAAIGRAGLNRRAISVINIIENGPRAGVYTQRTVQEYPITVGGFAPVVKGVNGRDIFLSNNRLKDGDLMVGPLVYSYPGNSADFCGNTFSGTPESLIEGVGQMAGFKTQLYFRVTGPGERPEGGFYEKLDTRYDGLAFYLTLRPTGRVIDLTVV